MKKTITLLMSIGISIFIFTSCNNSDNNKTSEKDLELQKRELDLRQNELALKEKQLALDSIQNANQQEKTIKPPEQTAPLKQTEVPTQDNSSSVKKLPNEAYGKYIFDLPCGMHGRSVTLQFFTNTNKVSNNTASKTGSLDENGDPKFVDDSYSGTFTVDKVNDEYKFVTCKFKSGEIDELKYSIKKKKWLLLTTCNSDTVEEFEGEKF